MVYEQTSDRLSARQSFLSTVGHLKPRVPETTPEAFSAAQKLSGISCPNCGRNGADAFKTLESRQADTGQRRRKQCLGCSQRFTTYEFVDEDAEVRQFMERYRALQRQVQTLKRKLQEVGAIVQQMGDEEQC